VATSNYEELANFEAVLVYDVLLRLYLRNQRDHFDRFEEGPGL